MEKKLKWKLGALAVGVAAAAGGGVAISSAAHSGNPVAAANGAPQGFGGGAQPGGNGFGPRGGGGPPGGGGPGGFGGGSALSAASTYLGISTSDLFTKIRSGTTLASIANGTSGKSAAGLIAAMVAAEKQQIEQAVTAGTMTRAQADQTESTLERQVTDRVNGSFRGPRGGGGPMGGPPGGGQDGTQSGATLKGTV